MNINYKIDDIVYVNGPWNVAEKCEITSERDSNGVYSVHSLDSGGSFGAFTDNVFSTKEDAIAAYKRKSEENIAKYKDKIKNLNDLLEFPLNHCFCGVEYTDYDAIQAYKTKAFELTGIVLPDDHDENEDEMGHWIIERDPNTGKDMSYHCSKCYEDSGFTTTSASKFCPNCGKRMHRQPIEENS